MNIFLKWRCWGDRIGAKDAAQQKRELPSLATPSLLGAGLSLIGVDETVDKVPSD